MLNQTVCFVWPKTVFCQGPCQILMKGHEKHPCPIVFFLQGMEGFGPAFDHQPCSEAGLQIFLGHIEICARCRQNVSECCFAHDAYGQAESHTCSSVELE